MGLAERRLAEQIKTEQLPTFLADLQAAMGFAPEVEIDWDSFMAYDHFPLNRMKSQVFEKLVETMKNIGQDAMGKQALADSIQKIVIRNGAARTDLALSLADKTLHLTVALEEVAFASYDSSEIIRYLEPKL